MSTRSLVWIAAIAGVAGIAAVIAALVWSGDSGIQESTSRPGPVYRTPETPPLEASRAETSTRPGTPTTPIAPRRFEEPERERAPETAARPAMQAVERFVKGRLVGDDRAPRWEPFISVIELVRAGGNSASRENKILLGADGGFRLAITQPFEPATSDAIRELIFTAKELLSRGPTYGARVDLTRELPPGETDLGTITLAPAPVIAAGNVVDQVGNGVAGARITPGVGAGQPAIVEREREAHRLREFAVDSDQTGAFEIRGFTDASELMFEARKHGWKAAASVRATRGSTTVRLTLTRGGMFEGKVLVDASVPITLIVVEFRLPTLPAQDSRMSRFRCDPDGTFRYNSEDAATFRVVVGAAGVEEPLADVPGIELRPGETTRDPRLDPLDLRGRLRVIDVKVVDADGRQVPEAIVFIEPKPTATSEYGIAASEGTASIVTTQPAVDLRVEAPSFRIARLPGVTADMRVVLRPGIRARFRIEGEMPKLPAGTTAQVKLYPLGPEVPGESNFVRHVLRKDGGEGRQQGPRWLIARTTVDFPLDASGSSGEVSIREPGTYVAQLMLVVQKEVGSFSVFLPSPPRVVVKDAEGVQVLSCPAPTASAVLESLKQLGKNQ